MPGVGTTEIQSERNPNSYPDLYKLVFWCPQPNESFMGSNPTSNCKQCQKNIYHPTGLIYILQIYEGKRYAPDQLFYEDCLPIIVLDP